ncbi:hypothetical protein D9611_009938 [Ephemerocybe angulata]|uniref:Uncharacterized protein n=1 Tax=Ephemerocybe angulata TaxID=980116 RepID=A0A8H5C464_9AGAR|nr:hypothetical protein D9611_009938 [Tulosesus angulatus]
MPSTLPPLCTFWVTEAFDRFPLPIYTLSSVVERDAVPDVDAAIEAVTVVAMIRTYSQRGPLYDCLEWMAGFYLKPHPIVRRSVANSASRAMGRSPNMTAQQAHDGGAMIFVLNHNSSQHHAGVSIHPHHRSAWTRLSSRPIHDHTGLFMSGYAEPLVNSTLVHCGGSSECGYVLRTQLRRRCRVLHYEDLNDVPYNQHHDRGVPGRCGDPALPTREPTGDCITCQADGSVRRIGPLFVAASYRPGLLHEDLSLQSSCDGSAVRCLGAVVLLARLHEVDGLREGRLNEIFVSPQAVNACDQPPVERFLDVDLLFADQSMQPFVVLTVA